MAQLNPNFEIDFDDINSYEQIQLINDTQLAKENLLMHKAYKEPAEDEIIRNQFSSFTFVDFCPKLFNASAKANGDSTESSPNQNQYVLETFSDLFDRINMWLKVNRDWRVISMETLIFDCASQFNHLKSSLHASNLARNMRGLRLYLSPTKSRFSGPQKIGCINVIPHKLSSATLTGDADYETLDQILARLNELLLTRPIEGRILSVETISLPIVDGYVNTETNYFLDNRLDALSQQIYSHASACAQSPTTTRARSPLEGLASSAGVSEANQMASDGRDGDAARRADAELHLSANLTHAAGLIDTLRVYYEFGPMVCGLVNLIDFLPRFNLRSAPVSGPALLSRSKLAAGDCDSNNGSDSLDGAAPEAGDAAEAQSALSSDPHHQKLEIDSTESLTRLVGRALNWFASERKRVLIESTKLATESQDRAAQDTDKSQDEDEEDGETSSTSSDSELNRRSASRRVSPMVANTLKRHHQVNLKVCNIQISSKILLKSSLTQLTPQTALEVVRSRQMIHEAPKEPIVCPPCGLSSATHEIHEWCAHLIDLNQAYELKFVRLAYVIPVSGVDCASRLTRSMRPLPSFRSNKPDVSGGSSVSDSEARADGADEKESANQSASSAKGSECVTNERVISGEALSHSDHESDVDSDEEEEEDEEEGGENEDSEEILSDLLQAHQSSKQLAREVPLEIVRETNRRHNRNELLHQLHDDSTTATTSPVAANTSSPEPPGQLIGQLTYRLFAPCQLVNSSSCFSINPVNSSNPLARRGSVISEKESYSDSATPSTLLIPASGAASGLMCDSQSASTLTINSVHQHQQAPISFGSFFPAFPSHETLLGVHHGNQKLIQNQQANKGSNSYRFATNEFEPVEAIRRRMEVYVTTNSMKVLAGETLVVNLSDHLSCLSNAIEQTLVKASFSAGRKPSTWVSVYVLYAAIDEPHLPGQLLEQQKLRERLDLISEQDEDKLAEIGEVDEESEAEDSGQPARAGHCHHEERDRKEGATPAPDTAATGEVATGESGREAARDTDRDAVPVFDDDFKCEPAPPQHVAAEQGGFPPAGRKQRLDSYVPLLYQHRASLTPATAAAASALVAFNMKNGNIRVESSVAIGRDSSQPNHSPSDLPPYNSAYDRTVALPTRPDDHLTNYLEPVDLNLAGSWSSQLGAGKSPLGGNDLNRACLYQLSSGAIRDASKSMRIRQQQQQLLNKDNEGESARLPNSRKGRRSRRSRKRLGEHSQCSLM